MATSPDADARRIVVDLKRLLHRMETYSPDSMSSYALQGRADLAQELLSELASSVDTDSAEVWKNHVTLACRKATEQAKRKKETEVDWVDEIFFKPNRRIMDEEEDGVLVNHEDAEEAEQPTSTTSTRNTTTTTRNHHHTTSSSSEMAEIKKEQREQLEEEISLMASQLKESTKSMNSTLQGQSSSLNKMADLAEENVDKVGKAASSVQQHNAKSFSSTVATWTMLLTIFGIFVFCVMTIRIAPKRKNAMLPCLWNCKDKQASSLPMKEPVIVIEEQAPVKKVEPQQQQSLQERGQERLSNTGGRQADIDAMGNIRQDDDGEDALLAAQKLRQQAEAARLKVQARKTVQELQKQEARLKLEQEQQRKQELQLKKQSEKRLAKEEAEANKEMEQQGQEKKAEQAATTTTTAQQQEEKKQQEFEKEEENLRLIQEQQKERALQKEERRVAEEEQRRKKEEEKRVMEEEYNGNAESEGRAEKIKQEADQRRKEQRQKLADDRKKKRDEEKNTEEKNRGAAMPAGQTGDGEPVEPEKQPTTEKKPAALRLADKNEILKKQPKPSKLESRKKPKVAKKEVTPKEQPKEQQDPKVTPEVEKKKEAPPNAEAAKPKVEQQRVPPKVTPKVEKQEEVPPKVEEAVDFSDQDVRNAAANGDLDDLKRMLAKRPDLASVRDPNGWEPIHEAANGGHSDILMLLLPFKGVNVNSRTAPKYTGGTPLYWANEANLPPDHAVIQTLTQLGAKSIAPGEDDA